MAKNKDSEFKEFLISSRKKIGPGLTNAPVWVLRKAGKRIWNPKQKRHWKNVDLGMLYRKKKKKQNAAKLRPKSKNRKMKEKK
ncbi:MAG: hypothetical protein JW772_02430 [Candidatus Diapherotrites archaeon]|nr:hypothetical protein [Candidatus Diapherotrites archaeon]